MIYAISIVVARGDNIDHTACLVSASNDAEALGKGYQIAHKIYPTSNGYQKHNVAKSRPDDVIHSADDAVLLSPSST